MTIPIEVTDDELDALFKIRMRTSREGSYTRLREWLAPLLARAYAEGMAAGREWQPIETAPKNMTSVIVACEDWVAEAMFHPDEGWYLAGNSPTDSWGDQIYPTYWQPLPPPPTDNPQSPTADSSAPPE